MHVPSYWEQKSIFHNRNIIVVGAGIVGISAAIEANRLFPDKKILIVDKLPFGAAASWRNAGFACFGSISEISSDIIKYGVDVVVELIQMRWNGLQDTINTFGSNQIGFEKKGGLEVFETKNVYETYLDELESINRILEQAIKKSVFFASPLSAGLSFYKMMIANKEEGMLDTGALMSAYYQLARSRGIEFIHGIEIDEIQETEKSVTLVCKERSLQLNCDQLMLCTNAMTRRLVDNAEVIPARNQVLITKKIKSNPINACYHFDEGYVYFRNIGDRILIGGARNKFLEEATDKFGSNKANLDYLIGFLNDRVVRISEVDVEYSWSGILTGGPSKIPIVKKVSDKIAMGVRLGGMGVAIGPQIGRKLATLLCN